MSDVRRAGVAGGAIIAALGMSVAAAQYWEGLTTHPHKDPLGNSDVCYGDRSAPQRIYTPEECAVLLVQRQLVDYQAPVLKCVPQLATKPHPLAAATDAAYNGGVGAFCASPMAAAYRRGEDKKAGDAYLSWHTLPGTKVHNGLVKRRRFERCLSNGGTVEQCIGLVA